MKIMIVDDEVIFRNGLSQVIDWQDLGLHLLAPAESAEEALSRLPVEKPDILITDIRMGGKSGLQLAEESRELLPDLEILILSGYDEFTYAQQAIRHKVGDYLLKTGGPEEIVKAVIKAKQRIIDRLSVRNAELTKEKEDQKRYLQGLVLDGHRSELIDNQEAAHAAGKLLKHHLKRETESLQVALFQASGWEDTPDYQSLLQFAVDNILKELIPCFSFIHQQRIVAVVHGQEGSEMRQSYHSIIGRVEELLNCSLFVSVGKPVTAPDQLHESYETASYTANYKAWIPGKWLEYDNIRKRMGGRMHIQREEELELTAILLNDDLSGLRAWVGRYMNQLLSDSEATLETLEAASQSAVHAARRWLEQVMLATGKGQEEVKLPGAAHAQEGQSISSKDRLFQQLNAVMKVYHHELADGQTAYVRKAIAYIEGHLGGDVSLQQVAKQVHVNPSHFSEVFKKDMGVTFGDYVISRKMARAKEILSVSPMKVSEVAFSVGYEDVKYFSQLFKKHTGKTPSEFRESGGMTGDRPVTADKPYGKR
ncbi:helix-turn-helix domain-containing protein [Paenibacillus senegalensis]|uniref:helix-turn-helix domain-containing protein n=1 Tax=Paenibacillus senegalensis TaxID=1465766 RepID=UPI000289EFCA|nr:helix-turn-helix domain-containing protein [Paenibacillus senegalensis]